MLDICTIFAPGQGYLDILTGDYNLVSMSGAAGAPVRRIEQQLYNQDGVLDIDYRISPRDILMAVEIEGNSEQDKATKRAQLLRWLDPANGALTLFTRSVGSEQRRIVGNVLGTVEMPITAAPLDSDRHATVVFNLRCPDPIFYSTDEFARPIGAPIVDWWLNVSAGSQAELLVGTLTPLTAREQVYPVDPGDWAGSSTTILRLDSQDFSDPDGNYEGLWDLIRVTGDPGDSTQEQTVTYEKNEYWGLRVRGNSTLFLPGGFWRTGPSIWVLRTTYDTVEGNRSNVWVYNALDIAQYVEAVGTQELGHEQREIALDPLGTPDETGTIPTHAIWTAHLSTFEIADAISAMTTYYAPPPVGETITVTGDRPTYPRIELQGLLDTLEITNNTTGKYLKCNFTVPGGETWWIDLRPGRKVATNQSGVVQPMAVESDMVDFALVPGPNDITLTVASGDTETVIFHYNEAYFGI